VFEVRPKAILYGNMDREKQIAMLRRSVVEWNSWRQDNPLIRSDLVRANLIATTLNGR
jgi:hypothetical protein